MAPDDGDRPWWETGAQPEPALSPRFRKYRMILFWFGVALLAGFVVFFVWVGVTAVGGGMNM